MHTAGKRILSVVLAVVIAVTTVPGGMVGPVVVSAATDHNFNDPGGNVDIIIKKDSGDHTITGTTSNSQIIVEENYVGTITLRDVAITVPKKSPMVIHNWADVVLKLEGDNKLVSAAPSDGDYSQAGITVYQNARLTIRDEFNTATLLAEASNGYEPAAGIGATSETGYNNNGTVIIDGGTITAIGAGQYHTGAGIGGVGYGGNGGNITISGGKVVAKGANTGHTAGGAAGIGGGGDAGDGGNITITGGEVEATGGSQGAGIGAGAGGNAGNITITGGKITATGGTHTPNMVSAGIGSNLTSDATGTIFIGGTATNKPEITATATATNTSTTRPPAIGGCENLAILPYAILTLDQGTGATNLGNYRNIYYLNDTVVSGVAALETLTVYTSDRAANIDIYVRVPSIPVLNGTGAYIEKTAGAPAELVYPTQHYTNVEAAYFSDKIKDDGSKELMYQQDTLAANSSPKEAELVLFDPGDKPTYELEVEGPDPSKPTLVDMGERLYGYTRESVELSPQEFTVTNKSTQYVKVSARAYPYVFADDADKVGTPSNFYTSVDNLRHIFSFSGQVVDEPGFAGTSMPAGGVATIKVYPKTGLDAGVHKYDLEFFSEDIDELEPVRVTLIFIVDKAEDPDAGWVTGNPEPSADPINPDNPLSPIALGASVNTNKHPNNKLGAWSYVATTSTTPPAEDSPLWNDVDGTVTDTVAAAVFPATPVSGDYYIHWRLDTKNTYGAHGTITATDKTTKIYNVDRTPPTATLSISDLSVAATFNLTVKLVDNNTLPSTISLSPADFTYNPGICTLGSITPISTDEFTVEVIPASGLLSGTDIKIKLNAGAFTDAAGNPNEEVEFSIPYITDGPEADFSSFNGNVYTTHQNSFYFEVDSRYPPTPDELYTGSNVLIDGSNAHDIFTLQRTVGSSTTTLANTVDYTVGYAISGGKGKFTVNPVGGVFTDGAYTVAIQKDAVKNAALLGLEPPLGTSVTGSFMIYEPEVTGILADTLVVEDNASPREVTFTITGKNLKVLADAGVLKLGVVKDPTHTSSDTVIPNSTTGVFSTNGTVDTYEFTLTMDAAPTAADVIQTFEAYLSVDNGATYEGTGEDVDITLLMVKTFILNVQNQQSNLPPNLIFGYESSEVTSEYEQVIRISNIGNQPLHNISIGLSGHTTAFDVDDAILSGLVLNAEAPGNYVDITVKPRTGLSVGQYNLTLTVTADNDDLLNPRAADPKSASLLPQLVTEKENPATVVVTSPLSSPTNQTQAALEIVGAPLPALRAYAQYAVTASPSAPNVGDSAWNDFSIGMDTATATFPYPDGEYYIHWRLKYDDYEEKTDKVAFVVDRGEPEATSITSTDWLNGATINTIERHITYVYTDRAKDTNSTYVTGAANGAVGFALTDINLTQASFSTNNCGVQSITTSLSQDGQTLTVNVTVKAADGLAPGAQIDIQPLYGPVVDRAGNPATQPPIWTGYFDGTRPVATLSAATPTNASPIPVTLTFDKPVTATAAQIEAALVIGNGSLFGNVTGSSTSFTFNVTPSSVGLVTIAFPDNVAFDSALNGNVGHSITVDFDNTPLKAELTTEDGRLKYNGIFEVRATFDRSITGLDVPEQFTLSYGIGDLLTKTSDSTFKLDVNPGSTPYTGDIDIQLKKDGHSQNANIQDSYGNRMIDSDVLTIQFDNTPLGVSLSTARSKVNGPFTVEVEFDKDVDAAQLNGNLSNIIHVPNGSVGSLAPSTGEGKRYTVTVTPNSGTGTATIVVPANTVKDSFGNYNTASNPLSVDYSDQVPTVSYSISDGDIFLRSLSSFNITASENLYDSAETLVGAAQIDNALRFTKDNASVSRTVTGSGNVFTIGSSFGAGRYSVGIPGGVFHNEFGTDLPGGSLSFEVWDPTVMDLSASPETLPSIGGDTVLTVNGMFLGDFGSLEVVRLGASSYPVTGITGAYGQTGTATATLPASPTVYDEEYEFEVYADGVATGIRTRVTVAGKGRPVIRSIAAQPNLLPYTGGTSEIMLSGEDLQNLPLSLTVSAGTDIQTRARAGADSVTYDIPLGSISVDGTSASVPIGFSGNDADRNILYTVEANVDGVGTGATTNVVLGSLVHPFVLADNPMILDVRSRYNQTGGITISLGMSDEAIAVAQRAAVSVDNGNIATISTRSVTDQVGYVEVRSQRKGTTNVHVTLYDYDDNVMPEYSTTIQVQVIDDYKYGTDGPGGGGGGGQDSDRGGGSPSTWWIELPEARDLVDAARQRGANKIPYRRYSLTGIRLESAHHMKGYTFYHDTIDEDGNVLVRITMAQPELVTHDTILTGYVSGGHVNELTRKFNEWFPNRLRVISMEEPADFGLQVELAAKLNMDGFDTSNLYLYSYDADTQVLTRIQDAEPWVDGNSFLHFYTRKAGDLIVSDGPLVGTDVDPVSADGMGNPSTGGGVNPYLPAFLVYLGARDAQAVFIGFLKGLGITSVVLLAGMTIWAVTPRNGKKRFRIKR